MGRPDDMRCGILSDDVPAVPQKRDSVRVAPPVREKLAVPRLSAGGARAREQSTSSSAESKRAQRLPPPCPSPAATDRGHQGRTETQAWIGGPGIACLGLTSAALAQHTRTRTARA